ncbi:MAG: MFS transporter [Methanomassiliicoccales archaeon]|jgi:MFS family permease|nr:MFS transporter [Methanomassiliicoccales archaeon]
MASFRGYDERVWILFIGRTIAAAGFSIVMPFLAIYLHEKLGVPMSIVGLIFLISSAIGAIGQLVGGEVADRLGRKSVMDLSIGARAAIFIMISFAVATDASFLLIGAFVVISNFLGSLFEPASNAMVADIVEPAKRLEAYGLLRIGVNIGWALGPLIGGFLAAFSYSSLFLLTAATSATVALLIYFKVEESMKPGDSNERFSFKDLLKLRNDHRFFVFCVFSLILWIVVAQMSSTFSVFSTSEVKVSVIEIGYLYTINGLIVVFAQLPIARYISRFNMSTVIATGALVYSIGYFLVGFAFGFLFLAFCMVIITLGEIITSPSSMNLVANMSPENERGLYMGFFGLFTSFGWSLGPFIGGVSIDLLSKSPVLMWGFISSFGVISAIGYILLGRRLPSRLNRVANNRESKN